MLNEIFSRNVKKYRKQKGLSQEKLAELANLHRTYIGGIELNKRNVSLYNIEKIANALEIPPELLLRKGSDNFGEQRTKKKS